MSKNERIGYKVVMSLTVILLTVGVLALGFALGRASQKTQIEKLEVQLKEMTNRQAYTAERLETMIQNKVSDVQTIQTDQVFISYVREDKDYYTISIIDKKAHSWLGADYRRKIFNEHEYKDTENTYSSFNLVNYVE